MRHSSSHRTSPLWPQIAVVFEKYAEQAGGTCHAALVIPAWLRKQFHIEDKTKAVVQATPEGILLKPPLGVVVLPPFGNA